MICPKKQHDNQNKEYECTQNTEHADVRHIFDKGLFFEIKACCEEHWRIENSVHDLIVEFGLKLGAKYDILIVGVRVKEHEEACNNTLVNKKIPVMMATALL